MKANYKQIQREAELMKKTKGAKLFWDSSKMGTYNVGKNEAKRKRREVRG